MTPTITSDPAGRADPASAEPAYRCFAVQVARTRRLSPSFLRITVTGPDLDVFGTEGLDQRIKLVLPAVCGGEVDATAFDAPDWHQAWRSLPTAERNPLRTYTVRAARPGQREVDVDVVLHGVGPEGVPRAGCGRPVAEGCTCGVGPAVRWCAAAEPGDPLVIVGPNARHVGSAGGIEWRPPLDARTFLLAGDGTAVPAIAAIVESLPHGVRAQVLLEVPSQNDVLDLVVPEGVEVTWLPRNPVETSSAGPAPYGSLLEAGVRSVARGLVDVDVVAAEPDEPDADLPLLWEVPEQASAGSGLYAWVAGEAGMVRTLRRFLLGDLGLDRSAVALMGYWRVGRPEAG